MKNTTFATMTKLTPYGRALALTGVVLIAATAGLVYLFTRPNPYEGDLIIDYQNQTDRLKQRISEYQTAETDYQKKTAQFKDSIATLRTRMAEQNQRMTNLKNQAHAAQTMDYRRFTDSELERLLSTRYQTSTGE